MKLIDLIQFEVRETGIALNCEITPGHVNKTNIIVKYEKVAIAKDGEPILLKAELRVCPTCFGIFAYDTSQIARDVHART